MVVSGAAADMSYMLGLLQDDGQFAATGNLYGVPENPYNFTRNQITTNQWVDLQFGHFPESEAGISMIFDFYPDLEADSADVRAREASSVATDWNFYTYAHVEASQHSRF